MQLRMVARRASTGWLTLLGDVAQATGPVAYERWDEVLDHLPVESAAVEELVLAYRVPAEIMRLALPLAPGDRAARPAAGALSRGRRAAPPAP